MNADAVLAAAVLLGLAGVIGVVGFGVGMLVARRLGRFDEPDDEETGGDD
jgi:hypothetical protein